MAKPSNKNELQEASKETFNNLLDLIGSLEPDFKEKDFLEGTLNRNVRDILGHLHHWHLLMLDWYHVGMSGAKPIMPADGYTWKMLPKLNEQIHQSYQSTNLSAVMENLLDSFDKTQALIEKHTDEELFTKQLYHWTGSTSLAAYFISNTSSHYAWAIKQIKRGIKK